MYQRSRGQRRQHSRDYAMPFLIIVCLGVILLLLFNLWRALFSHETARAAYMYVVSGSAQIKIWGTEDFFDLDSDTVIMQGDEIRSAGDARIIVEFFDGTIMRVDGSTQVRFENVDDESRRPYIELVLFEGKVWFNKVYKDTAETDVRLVLDNILVKSAAGSVFEIENGLDEVVRVFSVFEKNEGVTVDVIGEDGETVVETEQIGLAQEIVFTSEVLKRYRAYQSPTVHSGISGEFENSNWYAWNTAEDKEPTLFEKFASGENAGLVKVDPEVVDGEDEVFEPQEPKEDDGDETEQGETEPEEPSQPEPSSTGTLTKPSITSVAGGNQTDENGFYRVTGSVATLTGDVSGAARVVVNGYTLQKFNVGDSTWTYYANASNPDLLKPGENTYEVYAEDASGNQSEKLVVKVFYDPPAAQPEPKSEGEPEAESEPDQPAPEASAQPTEPISESGEAQ